MIVDIDLGDDDCESKQAKSMLKVDVVNRPPTLSCVAFHQFILHHETRIGGHHCQCFEIGRIS